MSVAALPLDPGAQARALLHHLLDSGDIVGRDAAGRAVIQLAADDWLLEQLLTFDAAAEDLENCNDAEPDSATVLCFDRASARQIYRGSAVLRQDVILPDTGANCGLDLG